jgi:hypothetical protein
MSRDYPNVLLGMIDKFLREEWDFDTFNSNFYFYFVDDVPEDAMPDAQYEFFSKVHEKLDWTSESPDCESRRYGSVDPDQFRGWLAAERERFRAA